MNVVGNNPYPSSTQGASGLGIVGRVLSPYAQFTPYPGLSMTSGRPSYRPQSELLGRNILPPQQFPNNVGPTTRPVLPNLSVSSAIPNMQIGQNSPPRPLFPNGGPVDQRLFTTTRIQYPRTPSYRPLNGAIGRNVPPMAPNPNMLKPASYYNQPTSSMGSTSGKTNFLNLPRISPAPSPVGMNLGVGYQFPTLTQNQAFSLSPRSQWQYPNGYNIRPSGQTTPRSYYSNRR